MNSASAERSWLQGTASTQRNKPQQQVAQSRRRQPGSRCRRMMRWMIPCLYVCMEVCLKRINWNIWWFSTDVRSTPHISSPAEQTTTAAATTTPETTHATPVPSQPGCTNATHTVIGQAATKALGLGREATRMHAPPFLSADAGALSVGCCNHCEVAVRRPRKVIPQRRSTCWHRHARTREHAHNKQETVQASASCQRDGKAVVPANNNNNNNNQSTQRQLACVRPKGGGEGRQKQCCRHPLWRNIIKSLNCW